MEYGVSQLSRPGARTPPGSRGGLGGIILGREGGGRSLLLLGREHLCLYLESCIERGHHLPQIRKLRPRETRHLPNTWHLEPPFLAPIQACELSGTLFRASGQDVPEAGPPPPLATIPGPGGAEPPLLTRWSCRGHWDDTARPNHIAAVAAGQQQKFHWTEMLPETLVLWGAPPHRPPSPPRPQG